VGSMGAYVSKVLLKLRDAYKFVGIYARKFIARKGG